LRQHGRGLRVNAAQGDAGVASRNADALDGKHGLSRSNISTYTRPVVEPKPQPEDWQTAVEKFWSGYGARAADVRAVTELGNEYEHLRDPKLLVVGVQRLSSVLPDCDVCAMVRREPNCLRVDISHAALMVMELQGFVAGGSVLHSDTTRLFEQFPALLLADTTAALVDATVRHVRTLKPVWTEAATTKLIRQHPALLHRAHLYTEFHALPVDIQNLLYHPSDGRLARKAAYDEMWDDAEWGTEAFDAEEWRLDGYDDSRDAP